MFTSGGGGGVDVIMSKQNYLACQTVNRFAKVSGTKNFNFYSERGASAPYPPIPTPVVMYMVAAIPLCAHYV